MEIVDLWTLQIEHEYYRQHQTTSFDIQISSEMRILLMRRNLVWRRKSIGEWCLSSFGDYSLSDEDILKLEVLAVGNDVQYVTDLEWPTSRNCYEVEIPVGDGTLIAKECTGRKTDTRIPNNFMKLLVPMGRMINQKIYPATTTLAFQSPHKYWEYIFLPRRPEMKKILRLEDMKGGISFGDSEDFDFMGREACKIRSVEKIPLQEYYQNVDLVVWERILVQNTFKDCIILRNIPSPEPTLNLGIAKDTVWRIVYY